MAGWNEGQGGGPDGEPLTEDEFYEVMGGEPDAGQMANLFGGSVLTPDEIGKLAGMSEEERRAFFAAKQNSPSA